MRSPILLATLAALLAAPAAFADPDKDESGHGHGRGHAYGHDKHKEVFREGNCVVERKWKHGEYEEKRKCREPERVVVVPAAPPPPRPVVVLPWYQQQQGEYIYKPQYRPAQVTGVTRCNSSTVGSVLGGIVGGVLGNQIGRGTGRTVATVGGAVAGVLVGGEIGRRMDATNQACVGEVLEVAPVGHRVQWAEGPTQYAVVPGKVQYVQGSYCRPYTLEIHTEHGPQRTNGTACRRPDGVWIAH